MDINRLMLDREAARLALRARPDLNDTGDGDYDEAQLIRLGLAGPLKGISEQTLRELVLASMTAEEIAGALARRG